MSKMARLGLFIVGSLALLFGGIFIIGNQQQLFTHSYRLRTQFSGVAGLLAGAEVRLGGVRKGTVDEILLPTQPKGQVTVTMSLDRSTASLVKKDSVAAIETEGVLGNKYLAISFGSPEAEGVKDWDTIAGAPMLDVDAMLKKTGEIMETTNHAMKNIDKLASEAGTLAARINRGDGTIGALVNDRSVYNQLNATMTSLAGTAEEARDTMTQAKVGVTAFQENMQALKGNFLLRGFYKDRGYQDSADLTKWETPNLPDGVPAKAFTFLVQDLFDKPESPKLKGKKQLNEVGTYLEQNPFGSAVIQAFSGAKGDQDENLVHTQAQAMQVRAYLAARFELDDGKLKTMGMGKAEAEPGKDGRIVISVYKL